MSTQHEYDPTRCNAWMVDLQKRLESHLAQMAPHQKERDSGKLLLASAEVMKAARAVIAAGRPHTGGWVMSTQLCRCPQCAAYDALAQLLKDIP